MNIMYKIDIVIPYVDGTDPEWIKLHNKYKNINEGESNTANRFRSMDNLVYVFRSIERNLKFINNVFLVVWEESQVPWWINRDTVKIITHKEFIPEKYLPTFNCNTIELFLHNIPELSEHFIYTNDDLFFLKNIEETDCFNNGKLGLSFNSVEKSVGASDMFLNFCYNSWFTLKGSKPKGIVSFKYPSHTIHPMQKSTLLKVWERHKEILNDSITPIRARKNINQYIFSDYEFINNNVFSPKASFKYTNMGDVRSVVRDINEKKYSIVCINDAPNTEDVFKCKRDINSALFSLFPHPSKYEKKATSKISVIMPCYNMEKYVKEAIDSVKAQTYDNWECIIVDDGSKDESTKVIENEIKGDKRFRLIRQNNSGVSAARNKGIENSDGEYIFPLDSDDTIVPDYLENAVDCLDKNPSCALCYGRFKDFGDSNNIQTNIWKDYKTLLERNSIPDTALYRRSDYDKTTGYNTDLKGYEDWEFWIRLLYKNDFVCFIDKVSLNYRIKQVSRNKNANKIKAKLISEIRALNADKYGVSNNNTQIKQIVHNYPKRKAIIQRYRCKNIDILKNFLH